MLLEPVIAGRLHPLVESELAQIFIGVLGLHQRASVGVEQVVGAGQEEAERRTSRERRQPLQLGLGQGAYPFVSLKQRPRLGDIEAAVSLEAPGIEADGDVVSERVIAGEIEVDQAGNLVAEKEDIVGEEVGMDDALRQVGPPGTFEISK